MIFLASAISLSSEPSPIFSHKLTIIHWYMELDRGDSLFDICCVDELHQLDR